MSETLKNKKWFLHVDLDAFFASVEQLDHPEYRGKPVIVGGRPEDRRGVVSTASYEARKFGVHSAMPGFMAYRLCPQGIFVHPRMERYEELSYKIMQIFRDFSPDVEQMSIDEAFIDLTGTENLFGPPEQTAYKIKERVKNETGLTVSIGLAGTKYIAKMASGYKKPDGFYFVQPGDETDFMLGFPLEKIWGVGQKSLENLNKGGIYSPRDILERDYETLEFQFGKNTASFLYDVMHNGGASVFKGERKSHSISAETTFPFDLTDSYTAETALMELSHEVFFRLLREESYSRTVMVKIRYNDFKTFTVQKTSDTPILTLDSFFEIVRELFEKKYSDGEGIRLLGVGFENVSREEKPVQQTLFDDGSRKKMAVEKAILKLEKKHPEIKIQKARTLKAVILCFFTALTGMTGKLSSANAQDFTSVTAGGAGTTLPDVFPSEAVNKNPDSLYSWDISDSKHIDFSLSGWWQGLFESSLLWSFGGTDDEGSDSNSTTFSPGTPVFKQAVDLTALVNLNNTWFFESAFSDEFKKNTYAVNYKGKGYLKEARLSNRRIFMQSDYSASYFGYGLKGGNNQAPGLSLHFEDFLDRRWAADFILRYDMTKTKTATFYGMNSVTETQIKPEDYMRGSRFVFPEDAASSLSGIKDIFVEATSGTYTDIRKKKYKKLSTSDYLIIESQSMVVLSDSANAGRKDGKTPQILITFYTESDFKSVINATGKYDDETSFAGQIEKYFNSMSQSKIKLSKYAGGDGAVSTKIEGENALIIQSSGLFSPYLCASYYDLGLSKDADILLKYKGSEKESKDYTIEQVLNNYSNVKEDFFSENHYYASLYPLKRESSSLQLPENRYPLADQSPQVYLNLETDTSLEIIVRTYSAVSEFLIGTNAAGGTVQVYKNGILDNGAKYYSDTGKVELSGSVSTTDKIYILWQEDSSNFGSGSLTGGAGFLYKFTEKLQGDISLTSTWPLSFEEKYSTQDNLKTGFAALTAGLKYDTEKLKFTEQLAASINTQNATGALLVDEQKDYVPKNYYLSSTAGYTTKAEPLLNWNDEESSQQLLQDNNGTILKHGGESDSSISGYKIPLSWDFSSIESKAWAAVDLKLGAGNLFCKSSELEITLKTDFTPKDNASYEVFLQLGVKAESSFTGEDSNEISTWKLTNADGKTDEKVLSKLNLLSKNTQKIRVKLYDEDRAKLSSNHDARLIVLQTGDAKTFDDNKGKIYFYSYKPYLQSIFSSADEKIYLSTTSEKTSSPSASELKKDENYSSIISWNITDSTSFTKSSETQITAVSYFEEADFSTYETISFDFMIQNNDEQDSTFSENQISNDSPKLTFILDNSAASSKTDGKIGIKAELFDISDCISTKKNWNTLSINLAEKKAFLNGTEISSDKCNITVNSKNIPSRMKIIFDTDNCSKIITRGSFYVDNLYYSNASINITAHHHTKVEIKKEGEILSKYNEYGEKQFDLIKNAGFTVESVQTGSQAVKNSASDSPKTAAFSSNAQGNITISGIELSADASISTSSNSSDSNLLKYAGHSIKTDNTSQTFIIFEESYRFNHDDKNLKKQNELSFDFSKFNLPITIAATANAQNSYSTQSQNQILQFSAKPGLFEFTQKVDYSQKINTKKSTSNTFNTNNYFEGWLDISGFEFSFGEDFAIYRNETYTTKTTINLPVAALKPSLTWDIQGLSNSSSDLNFTDSQGFLFELPFKIKNNNFKFKAQKTSGGIKDETDSNGTYFSDTRKVFEIQKNRTYLYSAVPFYDLFQNDLQNQVQDQKSADIQKITYSTKYETLWNRPLYNTTKDLFIPSFASFTVSRDITSSTKNSDVYQFKTSLTNNSNNNFGKESFYPVFNWYNQDEIMTSFTGIIKLPSDAPENTTYIFAAYTQILFYIDSQNTLKSALDLSLETNLDYSGKTTIIWEHSGLSTPIAEIAKAVSKKARDTEFKITRKETLNFLISKESLVEKQSYFYTHSVEAKFLKYFTLTTSLGGEFNHKNTSADTLLLSLSIGGKAEF